MSHLEREAQNLDECNYSVMHHRQRMLDDDAGYYPALKCKPHAAGYPRDSNSGSHYLQLIRLLRINRKLREIRRVVAFINYPRFDEN